MPDFFCQEFYHNIFLKGGLGSLTQPSLSKLLGEGTFQGGCLVALHLSSFVWVLYTFSFAIWG